MGLFRSGVAVLVLVAGLAGCGRSESGQPGIAVGEEALRDGSPQLALQVAQGLLARSPDDVPALLIQGDAATQLGQNADANAAFLHVLKLRPDSVHAKVGLGRLRLGTDASEAVALFQDVLRQEPRNLNALNNLGIARDLLGQHREAQGSYRQARAIDPGNTAAQVNLALSLAMSGNSADALRLIEPLATDPASSSKVRHDYAAVLAMAGREHDAEDILSHDLSPSEVKQVLDALRQQRSGGG